MSADFNERSQDAMFSRILERMDNQDESLARIESSMESDGRRLDRLEREKWYQRGVVAALSVGFAAVWEYLTKK